MRRTVIIWKDGEKGMGMPDKTRRMTGGGESKPEEQVGIVSQPMAVRWEVQVRQQQQGKKLENLWRAFQTGPMRMLSLSLWPRRATEGFLVGLIENSARSCP